jgi:UDPglucose 6-dehydrogenase
MAQNFRERWYDVTQYSLEEPYVHNKEAVKECDTVFVAVPTPTTDRKFDGSILERAIREGTAPWQKIVTKSTILVGTTDKLQELFQDRYFFHSAEFLTEKNAKNDVDNPTRNVVGYTEQSKQYAQDIMDLLPESPYNILCTAKESEMGKYMSNFMFTSKVVMANIIYDICQKYGIDYDVIRGIAGKDPRIGEWHLSVVDENGGRGANGHCFPKDLSAVHEMYGDESLGHNLLEAVEQYNLDLNLSTDKDVQIIKAVFGI